MDEYPSRAQHTASHPPFEIQLLCGSSKLRHTGRRTTFDSPIVRLYPWNELKESSFRHLVAMVAIVAMVGKMVGKRFDPVTWLTHRVVVE